MANRDDFGFMIAFSQFIVSVAESVQQRLARLPTEILTWIIVLFCVGLIVTCVFKFLMKDKQPIAIGVLKIPFWTVPSTVCMVVVCILLFL